MDWIKVTVRHAEYDFVGAPDSVFRTWIMAMILTAAIERIPTQEQLESRLGADNYTALCKHLKATGTSIDSVLKKVMEDVETVRHQRKHNSRYMSEYRRKALHKPLQNPHVNGKIREDKIREDKIREDNPMPFSNKISSLTKALAKTMGDKA